MQVGTMDVPPGKIATVVTYLAMHRPPEGAPAAGFSPLVLERLGPDLDRYRALFRAVGEPWLWFSRLVMTDAGLRSILADPGVEAYALRDGARDIGLLELDFRGEHECELAFFGLVPDRVGTGAGRALMHEAVRRAFAWPIRRLFVHTCTLDHPAALAFYIRSGFAPYKRAVEIADDPRLQGHVSPGSAAHHPVIAP